MMNNGNRRRFNIKLLLSLASLLVLVCITLDLSNLIHEYILEHNKKRVLITIPSLLSNEQQRKSVRESWGNFASWPHCQVTLQLRFYVGNPKDQHEQAIFEKERSKFGDMEQLDLDEGYYDLTRKIKKMFSHAVTHNTRWKFPTLVGGTERTFDYVIKADEDTFINIPVICANFHKMPVNGVYGGKCHMDSVPYRQNSHIHNPKFIISMQEFPNKVFPPYCEGAFYYMSKDMAVKLVQGFSVAPYFKLEDVFIGIAFKEANVKLTDIERANNNYHYLYSFEKVAGLEIGYSDAVLRSKWALHPVVTFDRLSNMHRASVDLHSREIIRNTAGGKKLSRSRNSVNEPRSVKVKQENQGE